MTDTSQPIRRCVLSKTRGSKARMLRLMLTPEGAPYVDLLGRAPGRGVYVRARRSELEEALTSKGLGRLFRGEARALQVGEGAALVETTIARLEARILELCSLARRAGQLVFGVEAVAEGVRAGDVALVLTALDASTRSRERLEDAISRLDEPVPLVQCANKAAIGRALGREDISAVGIRPGTFVARLDEEAERLQGLCLREGN